jgi:hypothetical protein
MHARSPLSVWAGLPAASAFLAPGVATADALLPRELDALGDWIAAQKTKACTEHCFALQNLKLSSVPGEGVLTFELEGARSPADRSRRSHGRIARSCVRHANARSHG